MEPLCLPSPEQSGSLLLPDSNKSLCSLSLLVVLHGNNLLVFGGTGIPFGESNGNDVHVCNVKYKRWALLSCRGKKPNRIYGQVRRTGRVETCGVCVAAKGRARRARSPLLVTGVTLCVQKCQERQVSAIMKSVVLVL